jgi:predicted TPR repeat methyltransferase
MSQADVMPSKEVSLGEAFALAQKMHREARLEGAEQLYLRIIAQQPRHADAWHFLGLLRYQRRDHKKGIAAVRRSLSIDPKYADAHANLANMLLERGTPRECEHHLKRACELTPHALAPRLTLAILKRAQRRVDESIGMLEQLLAEFEDNALVHNALGKALLAAGRTEEALPHFVRSYRINPALNASREESIYAMCTLDRFDEARDEIRRWLEIDPENPSAHHLLAACGGAPVPARCNDGYVRNLFDGFAGTFDAKLEKLDYRGPDLIAQACDRLLGPRRARLDALDAGCGTGLLGPRLRPWCRHLVGVDLSPGMLAKARERDSYDELVEGELTAHLRTLGTGSLDLIACADTLCYFGAVEDVMGAAYDALAPGGWFLFSVEHDPRLDSDYRLQFHGRYTHRGEYVERAVRAAGFEAPQIEQAELRVEVTKPVPALLVAARKASA